ncbi:MAG: ornithine cyclodeaminase family protein, partial [Mesorhizobium sp.]
IIVTTTPSTEPLIKPGFVSDGQHITAMGSDAEHKNEIAPAILRMADLYVADSAKQTRRLGELHHAIEAAVFAADAEVTELGQIIAGGKHGRRSASDITIADLTGTGVQDTAIATLARDRARAAKAGTIFES